MVGKTALIRFLAENIYRTRLEIFNINAGVHEQELIEMMERVSVMAEALEQIDGSKKIWVFFDEFNTTDELTYIK